MGGGRPLAVLAGLFALFCTAAAWASAVPVIFKTGFETVGGPNELSAEEAARFLDQASYGGRLQDIAHLRTVGVNAWLDEQFAAPISLQQPYLDFVRQTEGVYQQHRLEAWFIHSAQLADPSNPSHTHSDQLRQRVAFALSEVMVVSDRNAALLFQPWALGSYSYTHVATQPDDRRVYATPVDQRLYFAGEAADTDHYGTVHAALRSGAAAAHAILCDQRGIDGTFANAPWA